MQQFTAYRSSTGKAFRTPESCLREEFRALKTDLIARLHTVLILPDLDNLDQQFDHVAEKLQEWQAKGYEYHAAQQEARHPKVQNLAEFRENYRETVLKTGTDDG